MPHKSAEWQPNIIETFKLYFEITSSFSTMACPRYDLSTTSIAALRTVCCISGILAVVENLVVLLAVRKIHSLRSTARHFLASLAAAELLAGFIANLYFSLMLSRKDSVPLRTESAVWLFTTTSVTFSLTNVALDRYIAITSPLQYHNRMTSTRCLILIMFSWCWALLGAAMMYVVPEENLVQMWICGDIISVFIPFCIIAFCYCQIYRATKSSFTVRENLTEAQQMAENNRQRKTANTFGIIIGLFILLFMPCFIFNCMHIFNQPDTNVVKCNSFHRTIWIWIAVISYFSAVCDPWVYAIRMRDFRMAVKEQFQSMCRRIMHLS